MDTSEKQLVYLEHPKPYIPDSKPGKGRKKTTPLSDVVPASSHLVASFNFNGRHLLVNDQARLENVGIVMTAKARLFSTVNYGQKRCSHKKWTY